MDINEFYTNILKSLDVTVQDGFLMIDDGDKLVNYTHNGLPIVLPTKQHVSSLLDKDDEGNIITVKHVFNPLDETVIKGDSISLTKLKDLVSVRLPNRLYIAGALLLSVAENKAHQSKTGMMINQFLVRLTEAMNPGITKIVDSKTIDKWTSIMDASFKSGNTKAVKVMLKKGGKIGSVKYNRVTTFKFPLYEELCKLEKNGRINGVVLRNKDITVFKIIYEYLIEGINERGIVNQGSNDNESPGFISLMSLYLTHMSKIQEVISGISGVDPELEDMGAIELPITVGDLKDLSAYKRELAKIPSEGDVARTKLSNVKAVSTAQQLNSGPVHQLPAGLPDNAPVNQVNESTGDPTADAVRRALYGNTSGVATPMVDTMAAQPPMTPGSLPPAGYGYGQQPSGYVQQQIPEVSIGAIATVGAFGEGATINQPFNAGYPQYPQYPQYPGRY